MAFFMSKFNRLCTKVMDRDCKLALLMDSSWDGFIQ
ncbi:Hypothetical protein Bdt_1728 [Bdellovibrio bacteriovorus str. Tiberius]|uniref:Uncharacterized protein n=1 Tax=Bdellovibrio bacteriovorus str. Tiberius TaxID=1069642 RepID=K7ZFE0_BDEBC|nr:Hypothetical protein Bdt_1728 [Bdellovibrio bacteriovorus str. Tiberius]